MQAEAPPAAPAPAPAAPDSDLIPAGADLDAEFVGKTFSGYKIESKLGEGGMGSVFLATQLKLQRKVAIKILAPLLSKDKSLIERFVREARSLARIDHANIVPVYDMFDAGGMFCIAMGYAGGGTVKGLLRKKRKLSERTVANILMESAQGLHAAFQEGIVHRDIKPDNLLLTERGKVKIADFGLVKATEDLDNLTRTGAMMGTPAYMSPEQWKDSRRTDHRSDLYSLGCAAYELLTGKPPYAGPATVNFMKQHVMEKPVPIKNIRRSISGPMADIVMRLLEKEPEKRYQTGAELAEALRPIAKSGDTSLPRNMAKAAPADHITRMHSPMPKTVVSGGNRTQVAGAPTDWGSGSFDTAGGGATSAPPRRRRKTDLTGPLMILLIGAAVAGYFYRNELIAFFRPPDWLQNKQKAEGLQQDWVIMRQRLNASDVVLPPSGPQADVHFGNGQDLYQREAFDACGREFAEAARLYDQALIKGARALAEHGQ